MERRVLLAIFLSFLVLYVYQALVVKPTPKPPGATLTTPSALAGASDPLVTSILRSQENELTREAACAGPLLGGGPARRRVEVDASC